MLYLGFTVLIRQLEGITDNVAAVMLKFVTEAGTSSSNLGRLWLVRYSYTTLEKNYRMG